MQNLVAFKMSQKEYKIPTLVKSRPISKDEMLSNIL